MLGFWGIRERSTTADSITQTSRQDPKEEHFAMGIFHGSWPMMHSRCTCFLSSTNPAMDKVLTAAVAQQP